MHRNNNTKHERVLNFPAHSTQIRIVSVGRDSVLRLSYSERGSCLINLQAKPQAGDLILRLSARGLNAPTLLFARAGNDAVPAPHLIRDAALRFFRALDAPTRAAVARELAREVFGAKGAA